MGVLFCLRKDICCPTEWSRNKECREIRGNFKTHLSSGNYIDQQKSPDNGHTREYHAAAARWARTVYDGVRFRLAYCTEATWTDPVAGGDGGALGFLPWVFCGAVNSGASEAYNSPLACLCGVGALLAGEGDDDDDDDIDRYNAIQYAMRRLVITFIQLEHFLSLCFLI